MTANVMLCLDKLAHPHTGMGQFSLNLARALAQLGDDSLAYTFLVPRDARPLLDGHAGVTLETITALDKEKVMRWTRRFGPLTPGQRSRVDVWHALAQDAKYLPVDGNTPVLLTIHDLNSLRDTDGRELEHRLGVVQSRVDRADIIATDSRFTADEGPVPVRHRGCGAAQERPCAAADDEIAARPSVAHCRSTRYGVRRGDHPHR